MNKWFKAAYIAGSAVLLILIWNSIDEAEGGTDIISRLMTLRFIGFIALMLAFYYIFFDFLGKRKKERNKVE